jgi:hypothetical protein
MSESQDVDITQSLIKQWLKDKRCTLWQQWDIVSESGLDQASKWMLDQIASIVTFAQTPHD